jgi:hypothetical protein
MVVDQELGDTGDVAGPGPIALQVWPKADSRVLGD